MSANSQLSLQAAISVLRLKQYWLVWAICLLLCAVDLSARFLLNDGYNKLVRQVGAPQSQQAIPILGGDLLDAYGLKLSQAINTEEPAAEDVSLNEPPDIPVSLGFWEGSEYSYQLLAVLKGARQFAVLYRTENESKSADIIEAKVGDSLNEFVVKSMSGNSLVLQGPDTDYIELLLFRPASHMSGEGVLHDGE